MNNFGMSESDGKSMRISKPYLDITGVAEPAIKLNAQVIVLELIREVGYNHRRWNSNASGPRKIHKMIHCWTKFLVRKEDNGGVCRSGSALIAPFNVTAVGVIK